MKRIAAAGLFLSLVSVGAFAETWNGVISDVNCGAKHTALTADDKACLEKCAKGGAAAAFVADGKVYKIENQDAVKAHLGHQVAISGTMKGDTIHVDSVKMM